ncbi:hypothetical protein OESDEN_15423 [Oesophagostomum dentatum]|uniref:Peptidase C1A papain C-terminal domain-containing protein n=1 Tax=Oesophagostomum dentatum TaxID=61180 RepID=A0A0B1SHP2_OESDE|nr:hypothetical protein OESDEN_15423 [Oesophagostomum dentatum]
MSYSDFKSRLMDIKYFEHERVYAQMPDFNEKIPESFDAREQWPGCDSIKIIRDQANCGSCWAVSAASAMSDRVCIQSNGRIKVTIDYSMTYANRILKNDILQSLVSDTDILTCCGKTCGDG